MLGLAIHTCSPQLGLALKTVEPADEPVDRHQVWDLGREVSSHLHIKLIEFIRPYDWQDLSFIAVAKGPGGFTGTRIGVVAARTLAQQLEIPLFGVSSLGAIAAQSIAKNPLDEPLAENQDIAVTMPAKREAVYGAVYRPDSGDLKAVLEEAVVPENDWVDVMNKWERPLRQIVTEAAEAAVGTAESVAGVMDLAFVRWKRGDRPDWSSVMPFYGQHPVHR